MTADDPYADIPRTLMGRDAATKQTRTAAMREELLDLCDREYLQLVRFVMRTGADLGQAEDAVQEAFLAAWRYQRGKIEVWERIESPSAWLRKVAVRSYLRPPGRKRRGSNRVIIETLVSELPETAAYLTSVDQVELSAQAMAVRDTLQTLPEEQRILMSFLLDGFTVAETARELNMNEQRARDLVRKARGTLKKQLSAATAGNREERGR